MRLTWHEYRYYPYERELARREASSLFAGATLRETLDGLEILGGNGYERAVRLTYFGGVASGGGAERTMQSRLESAARPGKNRQSTRYSVHGLHEYKGKFNPQVVKALLNILGVEPGQRVLDPFCGSGTTLVECSHLGIASCGIDVNPLAVFIANAKTRALAAPAAELRTALDELARSLRDASGGAVEIDSSPRSDYLKSWFDDDTLRTIELTLEKTKSVTGDMSAVFLASASNLLRDYSLQDPNDLRIRRRKTKLPTVPFIDAFLAACGASIRLIEATQALLGVNPANGRAILGDIAALTPADTPHLFDAVITSPPYAMALPYIDTHRLSLVWLGLVEPERIRSLESEMIGSREIYGCARARMIQDMRRNEKGLPESEFEFCSMLQSSIGESDGFRRKAVPALLYRYFASMQRSFRAIRSVARPGAPFALIVGQNHSVLGGVRREINTPSHLTNIAEKVGWSVEESIPLQTYRRYGYHMNNAVKSETLIIIRSA